MRAAHLEQTAHLKAEFAEERRHWRALERELLTRIQAPEKAAEMAHPEPERSTEPLYARFDDDESFAEALS
jgi:hypothetical protein